MNSIPALFKINIQKLKLKCTHKLHVSYNKDLKI